MPQTYNGIGTWYWGKTNIFTRRGVCEHCGHYAELRSYDTTKYVVVFLIPLIPLGRKRVTDECPNCTRHTCVGLNHWRRTRDKVFDETQRAFADDPKNDEAAEAAIGSAVLFQDKHALDEIAARLKSAETESTRQSQLLGHAYSYFGRYAEAESALQTSLRIKDDDSVRDALAYAILLQGKPDKAWPYLQPILEQRIEDSAGLVLLAAESYQTWGMHEAALKVLDEFASAFPARAMDKEYRDLHKVSEKHLSTGKKINSPLLTPGSKPEPLKTQTWRGAAPRLVLPLLLVAFAFSTYWSGRSHDVILLNGLGREYAVSLNGVEHVLPPAGRSRITVPAGELTVTVLTPNLPIPEQTCRIETPFFTRLFKDHTFVLNPDRTALLFWQEVEYAERPRDAAEPIMELHVGELLSHFTGLDYFFEEFPDSLTLQSGGKLVKQRIALIPDATYTVKLGAVLSFLGREAMLEYAKRKSQYDPDVEAHIVALWNIYPADQVIAILKPLLQIRPMCLWVHRVYQHAVNTTVPDYDLVGEYRRFLQKEPANSDLKYFLGRVTPDFEEAERYFEDAITGSAPSAAAYASLALCRACCARFPESLEFAQRGLELRPDYSVLRDRKLESLLALGDYESILKSDAWFRDYMVMPEFWESELKMYCLSRQGRAVDAPRVIDDFLNSLDVDADEEYREDCRATLTAILSYLNGDEEGFANAAAEVTDENLRFDARVCAGQWQAATEMLDELPGGAGYAGLTLYLAAQAADAEEATQTNLLTLAIDRLRGEGYVGRRVAAWLTEEEELNANVALHLRLGCNEKAVALTALGILFPENGPALFELADKLNFNTRFPHLLLKELHERTRESAP